MTFQCNRILMWYDDCDGVCAKSGSSCISPTFYLLEYPPMKFSVNLSLLLPFNILVVWWYVMMMMLLFLVASYLLPMITTSTLCAILLSRCACESDCVCIRCGCISFRGGSNISLRWPESIPLLVVLCGAFLPQVVS